MRKGLFSLTGASGKEEQTTILTTTVRMPAAALMKRSPFFRGLSPGKTGSIGMQASRFHRAAVGLFTLMFSTAAAAEDWSTRSNLNLRPGVTKVSHEVYDLHSAVLWAVTIIGLLVFGVMFYSMVRHRRSKHPTPATFHENLFVEILWTVIPFIILIAMAIPATRVLIQLEDTAHSALIVKVTGHRWKWEYEYLKYGKDNDIGVDFISQINTPESERNNPLLPGGLFPYGTAKDRVGKPFPKKDHNYNLTVDHPLVLPSGQRVRFLITSDDVIHSFWIPDFGGKKDAIPGYVNEKWVKVPIGKEGTYYGQCTELCGKGHSFMPIEAKVVSQQAFKTWLDKKEKEAKAAPDLTPFKNMDAAMQAGKKVFAGNCAVCHGAKGQGGIGVPMAGAEFFSNSKHKEEHIKTVIKGKNAMPSFKAQLTPKQIAAVITYERNAWGNNSGDLVQPADVNKDE